MTKAKAGINRTVKAQPEPATVKALYRHRGKKHAPPIGQRSPLFHKSKPSRRVCLMCEKIFDSKDVGNRRCLRCERNLAERMDRP